MPRERNKRKKIERAVEPDRTTTSPPVLGSVAVAVRAWLAVMFGATLWVTRHLWEVHDDPPMLSLVELPRFQYFGYLMFAGYAAAVVWPRAGLAASVAFGALAMVADQTRMQPTIFSFWLLLLATWPRNWGPWLIRCYLVSLWFFSGFHKLLSDAYLADGGAGTWMFGGIFPPADWPRMHEWRETGAVVLAASELGLSISALIPRLRKVAAVWAVLLHVGIVITLHRLGNWNTAVWPWNFALVVVAPWLLFTWKESPAADFRAVGRRWVAAGAALALAPSLYYVGLLDAYLSHCLYSSNVPFATFYGEGGIVFRTNDPENSAMQELNVPFPPAHRNFELYFRRRAQPGDMMIVYDLRPCARRGGYQHYYWTLENDRVVRKDMPKPH
jgi:uncharacterized membrane protein YphA (DoxX/SURF4 family)